MKERDEPVLENDYPVYPGYLYVADGEVVQSPVEGNVRRLERAVNATEIRRCDMAARDLF